MRESAISSRLERTRIFERPRSSLYAELIPAASALHCRPRWSGPRQPTDPRVNPVGYLLPAHVEHHVVSHPRKDLCLGPVGARGSPYLVDGENPALVTDPWVGQLTHTLHWSLFPLAGVGVALPTGPPPPASRVLRIAAATACGRPSPRSLCGPWRQGRGQATACPLIAGPPLPQGIRRTTLVGRSTGAEGSDLAGNP